MQPRAPALSLLHLLGMETLVALDAADMRADC